MHYTSYLFHVFRSNFYDETSRITRHIEIWVTYCECKIHLVIAYFNFKFDSSCFQSKSIGDALYESLWYNMSPNNSRILLFMILRSQKRLTITAGKIIDLTLEGFTSVRHCAVDTIHVHNMLNFWGSILIPRNFLDYEGFCLVYISIKCHVLNLEEL